MVALTSLVIQTAIKWVAALLGVQPEPLENAHSLLAYYRTVRLGK
jgi:hypothetical protein